MKAYRIRDWDKHFENNRSRTMVKMQWVPVPNKHDGEGFAYLMSLKDGMAIYGAWHLILQVASKCQDRGSLMRENGTPHTAASISMKTRGDPKIIEKALEICSSLEVAWLDVLTEAGTSLSGGCQEPVIEGKGIEEKEENADKGASYPVSDDDFWKELRVLYDWIDLDAEISKMRAWTLTPRGRNRKITRRFAVNWLNKIDKPLSGVSSKPRQPVQVKVDFLAASGGAVNES